MNKKTSKKQLLDSIKRDVIIYLRSGKLEITNFLDDVNLNINGLDKLLKIHFLLDSDVRDYILDLNKNISKFNNSTVRQNNLLKGRIKGSVNWQRTIQVRNNINPLDKTIFVCNENYKNFNTNENLILKTFLKIMYDILNVDINNNYYSYEWFKYGAEIRRIIENIYCKNIYISKIYLKDLVLDDRKIQSVSKSRNVLYKGAAELLKKYKKIISLDPQAIQDLLQNTFIKIANESTLFELFWVMKTIKDNASNVIMNVLNENNDKVAEWEKNNKIYSIYHNCTGSNDINFNVKVNELRGVDNEFIKRKVQVMDRTNFISKKLFTNLGDVRQYIFQGRPDIIIEVRNKLDHSLEEIIIGEVKYTNKRDYSLQGLEELLEYINFIKVNMDNKFLYIDQVPIIKGILFLDNIHVNKINDKQLRVITMKDKENKIDLSF